MASGDRTYIADKVTLDTVHTMISNNILGGSVEFEEAGDYSFTVPQNVNKIIVTACGGGGGGGNKMSSTAGAGAGGGGGAAVKGMAFEVTEGQVLSISVGAGGEGAPTLSSSNYTVTGKDGGSTTIGDLITLAGGTGGKRGSSASYVGKAGGEGGGDGGRQSDYNNPAGTTGGDGVTGKGGKSGTIPSSTSGLYGGGGGGGSLGNGGDGGGVDSNHALYDGNDGIRGGGGGGGGGNSTNYQCGGGGRGGDGYVLIVWGFVESTSDENGGAIKSIQRGTTKNASSSSRTTITISKVNPNKCVVLLNGYLSQHGNSSNEVYNPVLNSLTENTLIVDGAYVGSSGGYEANTGNPVTSVTPFTFTWQVIELY